MKKALTIALLLVAGTTTLWARGDTTIINTDRTIVVDLICASESDIYTIKTRKRTVKHWNFA